MVMIIINVVKLLLIVKLRLLPSTLALSDVHQRGGCRIGLCTSCGPEKDQCKCVV